MADAFWGRPFDVVVGESDLSGDISRVLTHHDGTLGRLFSRAESIERGKAEEFEPERQARDLDFADLQKVENATYVWTH